jgi:IS5 family transposase
MEEMDYNILFRWFVGLNLADPVWDATIFTKNRDRLLEAEVAKEFLARVVAQAGAGEGMDFGRAIHCRRQVAGGVGQCEEFSALSHAHQAVKIHRGFPGSSGGVQLTPPKAVKRRGEAMQVLVVLTALAFIRGASL